VLFALPRVLQALGEAGGCCSVRRPYGNGIWAYPIRGVDALLLQCYLYSAHHAKQKHHHISSSRASSLFVRLISHQSAVLFSQNKPATSNQPTVLFSHNKSVPAISHQPNEQAVDLTHFWWGRGRGCSYKVRELVD
jgi:hypothetical protein